MLQKFVVLKGTCGKPLKRVFMSVEQSEIVVCDPEKLEAIKSGEHALASVAHDRVFNFEEDAYHELLLEWKMSKETSPATWMRLGNVEVMNEVEDHSSWF
jgi:hypothetical protein